MAAGRHGGYRDNEFRERAADFGMPRKEIIYLEGEFDQIRKVTNEFGRGQGRSRDSLEYRNRLRHKDIKVKEREVTNGAYRSTLSRSGRNGVEPSRYGITVHPVDREPGELSSDGSDGSIDPEAHVNKETEAKMLENGSQSAPLRTKKRKFSPIIWDRDDREAKQTTNSRSVVETTILTSKSPLAESYADMSNSVSISDADIQTSLTNGSKVHISEASPPNVDSLPYLSESHNVASSPLPPEGPVSKSQGTDTIYEDDRTIKSSRWANDADSPADEGEISDYEDHRVLKRKSGSESGGHRISISPGFEEVKREGSEKGRSSSSDERVRSASRDSYHDTDDRNEYREIDDNIYDDTDGGPSDMVSKDDLRSCGTPEPTHLPQRSFNMLQGCRSVDEFERLNKIAEGTYGVVYRARDKKSGEIVALKMVKMEKERKGFPLTSLREINILLSFHHPYIVDVKEVVTGCRLDSIFMVMEYMEHDLKALMETMTQPFSQSEVKCLILQLLEGTKYLHDNWVMHRDLKTSNLLLNNRGELKICDFGLARQYGSPLKPYTLLVVTLWYRAPELLLGAKQYSTAIDMWSLGCIMAELLSKEPLFNGKTEVDQLDKIYKILGTPSETIWPGLSKLHGTKVNFVKHKYNMLRKKFPAASFTGSPVLSDAGFDLLNKLLTYDPEKRITAEAALRHEWFREVPLPKSKEFMPIFPAQHAQDRRTRRVMKSPDPLEEQRMKELQGELGTGGLFGMSDELGETLQACNSVTNAVKSSDSLGVAGCRDASMMLLD